MPNSHSRATRAVVWIAAMRLTSALWRTVGTPALS
jgi:hypothetical protein